MADQENSAKEQPQQQKPELPVWQCRWLDDEISWSVGQKRDLQCWGEASIPKSANLRFEFPNQQDEYALKILETRVNQGDQVQMTVTAYKPGPHKNTPLHLLAGDTKLEIKGLSWTVKSVLPEGKPPKPFGPFGPVALSYPWWVWLTLVLAILIPCLWGQRLVRRWLQRKRLREELSQNATALSPYHHFSKELRQMGRKYQSARRGETPADFVASYLEELQEAFAMYLTRELIVPAKEWSAAEVVRETRRRFKKSLSDEFLNELRKLLVEFERGRKEVTKLSVEDCDQLLAWSRKVADQLQIELKGQR